MKESDIRPEDLLKQVLKLHSEDVLEIMQHKNQFAQVNCPSCESEEKKYVYEKEGFKFVKCNECKTVYINPRPTSQLLADFYANSKSMKYWNDILFPTTEKYRKTNLFKKRAAKVIELCKKYGNDFETIMDVGAGYGTFCQVLKESNMFRQIIAVEPTTSLAKTCESKGILTINKPIENVSLNNISVITNFEVIEHLYNPLDFVKSCSMALPSGGLFVVTTPNIEGFEMDMLKTISPNVGGPDHLNYFTPTSLKTLLEKCEFEILEITTPGELDAELVRKEILKNKLSIELDSFIYKVLIDKWDSIGDSFQKFLSENQLSSHMWAVARKK